jgi:hypothetical protein
MKKLGLLLAIALMLGTASVALAQNVGDGSVYFVTYFSNANTAKAPDATVRTVNDGDTGGNLWAAYYVFDDSQELSECGACFVSPDGVNSESVNAELTANPLTGRYLSRGVIKMISSSTPDPTATKPTSGLRPWSTHIQKLTSTTFAVTETKFADANLSAGEQTLLQNLCYYAQILGSGTGVITCTPEDRDF